MQLSHCFVLLFFKIPIYSFSVRPGHFFRKLCLVDLKRLPVVGIKSATCKYCAGSGFDLCARILFVTASYFCVSRGTSHITVFLFLVLLIIYCPFLWNGVSCLSSVMIHPSSHKTSNDINGDVIIFGKIWICLACLLITGSWSVAMCEDSIVIPSGSLAVVLFRIITGAVVVVDCFAGCIFAPESAIDNMLFLGGLGGVSIQFIKIILGLLI